MKYRIFFVLIAIANGFSLTSWVPSQSSGTSTRLRGSNSSETHQADFQREMQLITLYSSARDFVAISNLAAEIQTRPAKNRYFRSLLLGEICKALASYDFQDSRQYILSVELAKDVLKDADRLPVVLHYEMVARLQSPLGYKLGLAPISAWERDRKERAEELARLWSRIDNSIDRSFDFRDPKNVPIGNVPVPGSGYLPGTLPKNIKEKEIRSQYLAAIEANNKKAGIYNDQVVLHRLESKFSEFAETYILNLYSEGPPSLVEVDDLFRRVGITSADQQSRIRKKVEEALQYVTN